MYLSGVPEIERRAIAPGKRGTRQTLEAMRALAREAARTVAVREAALRIVRAAGVAGHDFEREALALFAHVRDRIRFVRDPSGAEWLQGPQYTLEHGFGDCDDKATALAALLLAIGTPIDLAFRVIGTRPDAFSHVYVRAKLGGKWLDLDPTYPETPAGWAVNAPATVADMRV